MSQLIETIFKDELTQQGLAELRSRFPADLVMDMSDDEQFKQARKIRTERNKLTEAIDRRRKDVTSEIKDHGDSLISQVTDIYDVVVTPFEAEDKRRKEEVARLKAIEEEKINESRKQVASIHGFISQCTGKDSEYIADMIESVDLIEVDSFHKEVIHEAIEAKKATLAQLTTMLSDAKARERLAAEEAKLAEERRKMEAERAEFEAWKKQQAEEYELTQQSNPAKADMAEQAAREEEDEKPETQTAPAAEPVAISQSGSKATAPRKLGVMEVNAVVNFIAWAKVEDKSIADTLDNLYSQYLEQREAV